MPFAITGGRYAAASVSSVGTTTVTVGTTPFVQADFTKQRLVGLWSASVQTVTNPGFDSDTAWTKGSGVTISGGVANVVSGTTILSQNITLVVGRTYIISLNYTMTSGSRLRFSNGTADGVNAIGTTGVLAASGTITLSFVAAGNGITVAADTAIFNGTIDNFTVTDSGQFKGMTWVRRWVSTSQLELERPFFDPATGATVTQAVGDQMLVSKDFAESVVTGLAVSGRVVSITDTCTFGVDGNQLGVCLYDENKIINATFGMLLSGGLTVFGKLDDYATDRISASIDIQSTQSNVILCNNAAVNFCGYGGRWESSTSPAYFIGGNNQGTAGNTVILHSVETPNDLLTNTAGTAWVRNPTRHQLVNCYGITSAANAICARWGNGIIRGGRFKIGNASAAPISIFGAEAGTYSVGAPASQRLVVLDMGNGPALVRTGVVGTSVTFNFTNLITTDFRSTGGMPPLAANANGTNTFRFSDTYTGLQPGTVGVILNNSGAVADSIASSSTSWSPSLLRRTCVGATVTVNATSWTFGFKDYGYQAVGGTITPTTYDLGTAGQADNVVFGGAVNQLVDTGVTLTLAQALALSSKFTASATGNGTLTVTANATYDEIYDYLIAWNSSSVALAQFPSISAYPIAFAGSALNTGMAIVVNAGVTLSAGAKFITLVTTSTVTNNGTINAIYTSSAGTSAQLSLTGLTAGSSIYVANGAGTQVAYVASSGTSYTLNIAPGATGTWTYRVARFGMQTASGTFTPSIGGVFGGAVTLIPDSMVVDTLANVQAYTDLNSTQKIYDYLSLYGTTNAGIIAGSVASKGFGTLTVPAGLTLDPAASALVATSGGVVTVKCSGLAEDATIISTGAFTQGTATLSNAVKIRASNLDSELTFNATSITLYPSSAARDAGTTPGPTSSNGIIRFKNGATVSGVVMGGSEWARVNVGVVLFTDFTLNAGANALDLGTAGQLAALSAKVDAKPTLAQMEASTALTATGPTASAITSAVRADLERTGGMLDTLPTLSEMEGSWKLTGSGLIDLGCYSYYESDAGTYFTFFAPATGPFADITKLSATLLGVGGNVQAGAFTIEQTADRVRFTLQLSFAFAGDFAAETGLSARVYLSGTHIARATFIPGGPTLRDIEASTVLAKKADLTVINNGVQKASLLVPHTTGLS